MACGLPAIAVDAYGPADIVDHGETGWLVEPDDVASLANALVEAVNRPGRAPPPRRQRRRGRRTSATPGRRSPSDVAEHLRRRALDATSLRDERRAERLNAASHATTPRLGGLARAGPAATVFAPFRALGWGFASPTRRPPMPERPSGRIGLYDPSYEHDACGVAMVAKLDGNAVARDRRARDRRAREPRAPRCRGRRPNTGDGAGILLQLPDEFIRGVIDAELPPPGAYGVCVCFLPREEERRERARAAARGHRRAPRASASSAGATCRSTRTTSASRPTSTRRTSSSSSWPRPTSSRTDQDAFERKLYVIRRVAEIAAGPELVIPSFSQPHDRLQGHAHQPAAAGLLPGPGGPAHEVRAGARPLALLARTRSRAGSSRTRTG